MTEKRIIEEINDAKSIAVLPHVSADGDALGSSLALVLALRKMGKESIIYIEEAIPALYTFLPGKEYFKVYDGNPQKYDLVVALDTGDLLRLGKRVEIFDNAEVTINIDHHPTNTGFASINLVKSSAAAVGELIYKLINMLGVSLDISMATCLYVAIATDTGGFRYSNTTSMTHQIAADLINNGVDVSKISQQVFEIIPLKKVRLMGLAIDTIEIFENGSVAFITVTNEMLKVAGASEEDCDGLVNIARNIHGIEVAVLVRQRTDDEYKINFRSQNYVDVSSIANKYSGGGHKKAAGCTVRGSMEEIKEMINREIREAL